MNKILYVLLMMMVVINPVQAETVGSYPVNNSPSGDDYVLTTQSGTLNNYNVKLSNLPGASSAAGFTDDGTNIRLTTSTDNVGIGTLIPGAKLEVIGTTKTSAFQMPTGSAANYILTSNSQGVGTWMPGGGGLPGGSSTQLQYNKNSAFAGSDYFTVNDTAGTMYVGGTTVGGTGNRIASTHSYVDLDDGSQGAVRFGSYGGTNNGSVDIDCESNANQCDWSSATGVTVMKWPNSYVINHLYAGGVQPSGTGTVDLTSANVSYYKLDDNAANTSVSDETGVNPGTASANTSTLTTTGKLGRAFNFTGTETVDLGNDSTLRFSGDFTVAAWIKTTGTSGSGRFLGNRFNSGTFKGFDLSRNSSNKLAFVLCDGSNPNINIVSTTSINTGSWYFVVAKRTSGALSLKINNVSEGSPTGTISTSFSSGVANMTLGGEATFPSDYYVGQLDNVLFFNRATTADEDTFLYNSGIGTTALTDGSVSDAPTQIIASTAGTASLHGLTSLKDLVVEGSIETQSNLYVDGDFQLSNGASSGYVLQTNSVGVGTWVSPSSIGASGGGTAPGGTNAVPYNSGSSTFAGDETKFSFNGSNVGIGTLNATSGTLSIVKTGSNRILAVSSAAGAGGDYFQVSNGGNVGVGTTAPGATNDIKGSADQVQFRVIGNATQTNNITQVQKSDGTVLWSLNNSGNATAGGSLTVAGSAAQSTYTNGLVVNSGATGNSMDDFVAKTNVGVGTFRVQASTGNIGIGSTTPGAALDLFSGTVRAVGMGTTVAQQMCRCSDGRFGVFNGAWASSCTCP